MRRHVVWYTDNMQTVELRRFFTRRAARRFINMHGDALGLFL